LRVCLSFICNYPIFINIVVNFKKKKEGLTLYYSDMIELMKTRQKHKEVIVLYM
jgi:hypothetical protein